MEDGKLNVEHHLLMFFASIIVANELENNLCRRRILMGLAYRMKFRRFEKARCRKNHRRPVAHFWKILQKLNEESVRGKNDSPVFSGGSLSAERGRRGLIPIWGEYPSFPSLPIDTHLECDILKCGQQLWPCRQVRCSRQQSYDLRRLFAGIDGQKQHLWMFPRVLVQHLSRSSQNASQEPVLSTGPCKKNRKHTTKSTSFKVS